MATNQVKVSVSFSLSATIHLSLKCGATRTALYKKKVKPQCVAMQTRIWWAHSSTACVLTMKIREWKKQSHMWVSLHACVHPLRNWTNSGAQISYEVRVLVCVFLKKSKQHEKWKLFLKLINMSVCMSSYKHILWDRYFSDVWWKQNWINKLNMCVHTCIII